MSDSAAVLELPGSNAGAGSAAAIEVPNVGCPKCGSLESWGRSSWCPQCGFYPRLGTSVAELEAAPETQSSFAPKTPLELWLHMPAWIKVLCTGVVAIFGMSLAVRAVTPDKSFVRSLWGTCQLLAGLGVFVAFHLVATIKASFKQNGTGFMDAIVHPFDVWRPTIYELPGSARRLWLAVWGLTATVCAVAIIGGIRYSVLVEDWGFRQRANSDIAAQIKAKAMEAAMAGAKQADSLEDAVKGAAAKDGENKDGENDLDMLTTDCVVVGYNVSAADGKISELLLASIVEGQLKYVGSVSEGITDNIRNELARKLPKLKQQVPIVKCPGRAVWVKPEVACRTNFKKWTEQMLMSKVKFKELLADVK
ncbi:MAG: hypothetical protein HY290_07620 [Planctomycetia bacterium]|nr:hypothetical protein [Planctomycetia bacterium]